jgi:hypothetical protein
MSNAELILSFQRALLFNILPSVRYIFAEIREINSLDMLVYTDRELSEWEKDVYYAVSAEVEGDFVEVGAQGTVKFVTDVRDYAEVSKLQLLIYARYEA